MAPYSKSMTFPTAVLVVNSVGLALSFFSVALRTYARMSRKIQWRLCDYTIIASWLFTFGLVVSENFCVTRGGIGQNTATVSMSELLFSTKQFIVIGVTGTLAVTLVKISLLDFFLSVFSIQRGFRSAAYVLMGITTAYGISFTVATLASCRPFEANWDKLSNPNYTCINTSHFYVAQCAIGAFLDIAVLMLPLPAVWNLKLQTRKKIALTFVFAIGIVICCIGLTRLAYNTKETYMLTHFAEYAGIAAILGALEANLTIICACLPSLPPLVAHLAERLRSSLKSFSFKQYRSTGATDDSIKLSSALQDVQKDHFRTGDMDLESARMHKYQDRLYPLSVTQETRTSLEADGMRGSSASQEAVVGASQGAYTWKDRTGSVESYHDGDAVVRPYSSINVTKTYGVE